MIATSRLYWCLGGLAVWGLVAGILPAAFPLWVGACGVLLVAALADLLWLRRATPPTLEREVPDSLAVGVWTEVVLVLRSYERQTLDLELFDKPPSHCDLDGMPASLRLPGDKRARVRYALKANERGEHQFEPCDARIRGPLGLLFRQVEIGTFEDEQAQTFRVLPNFKAVSRYALMATADRVGELGIKKLRRRGSGMEFSHLRDYRQGDLSRQIDWKASARRSKLISREYEDERNQHIVFLLDCGRRMRARDEHDGGDKLAHFDHCLNASLLLSHVALKQGDSVALATFGGHELWVPRQKGPSGMNAILEQIYDLQTTTAPSDYSAAARRLAAVQRRRALVVVLTNLYDQDNAELLEAVSLLRQRHVVLVASLREAVTEQTLDEPIYHLDDALRVAAGHHYLSHRDKTHQELQGRGVMLLDVQPGELSVQLVNRYLAIKRAGML
ncbi:DUF58 domain-containing protein [Persicimonas caeni]|uniref:DUF58 domain-containing protein n=1 Tax=Persicimonas caeni TaxID=2292766 RepID=A0A4Y6PSU1_PERCE|nr:DUF58 domain-containing protein [Persicimonas caeni]QDG51293.1 DUF58 domain-containing protein [Persicimonas caeni]QED32514.1 DUF58 domain-containing protein [Persicimonas caeni]